MVKRQSGHLCGMADFDGQDSDAVVCKFARHELREGLRQRIFSQCDLDSDFPMARRAQIKNFGLSDGCSGGHAESFVIKQKPKKRLGVEP